MPERPLTIATYAAGASLAAVTLVYVFGPTFFLDDDAANSSRASRKRGVVGLVNPANDCFMNSVLQALAGLPELRLYLIREMHRRKLDGPEVYDNLSAALEERRDKDKTQQQLRIPEWKILGLQHGLVTAGLKDVLDALNERPIYKKTISAQAFIRVVEQAFKTRISRSQQDAQEFLQIIAERLADEHNAGNKARNHARRKRRKGQALQGVTVEAMLKSPARQDEESLGNIKGERREEGEEGAEGARDSKMPSPEQRSNRIVPDAETTTEHKDEENENDDDDDDNDDDDENEDDTLTFPFEGKLESRVECSHCHFKPRPHTSSFVSLTLHVPQGTGATTLGACLDGMLKVEHIDDFTCDKCRLEHALEVLAKRLSTDGLPPAERDKLEDDQEKIQRALDDDPEKPPEGVELPDRATAPQRRISRHMRIASFPRILAVHLSRSVWDPQAVSTKNVAKVAFPETMPLGGLLDRHTYRLLGVVTHKGGHNSGHYESFRRQFLSPPYSTPASMGTGGIFSLRPTPTSSPRVSAAPSPRPSTAKDRASDSTRTPSPPPPPTRKAHPIPTGIPLEAIPTPGLPTPPRSASSATRPSTPSTPRRSRSSGTPSKAKTPPAKRKTPDRWWRISDEKVKESKTSEVLAMQREVYLLFYEMVADE